MFDHGLHSITLSLFHLAKQIQNLFENST